MDFIESAAGGKLSVPMLFVTHHVEEIRPVFTHALILKGGRILAAGPIQQVLTSKNLTSALETPARISRRRGRYKLTL